MTDQTTFKKELLRLSKTKLIKKCKMQHLSINGTKLDMINRLMKNKKFKHTQKNFKATDDNYISYTPTTDQHHIDKFQLKPRKIHEFRLKKSQSLYVNSTKSKRTIAFGVGSNVFGEFGLNHTITLTQLTNISKTKSISKIYNGFQYTIYADNISKKYWASGYNSHGQCAYGPFDEWLTTHKSIDHFYTSNLTIKKICMNVAGNCTFWITNQNRIYGNGRNDCYQLGIGHNKNATKPTFIKTLTNIIDIIDIQSAHSYSIALSSIDQSIRRIVRLWAAKNIIKKNITRLIAKYIHSNNVYVTCQSTYGGNGYANAVQDTKWKKLKFFDNKKIVKIRTGSEHSLFVQNNGSVWCCGDNAFSQLGLGHDDVSQGLMLIKWFKENNIKIVDIKCGLYHNLAIDDKGKCYAWGLCKSGQCGVGNDVIDDECISNPQLIKYFVENKLKIKQIDCGNYHSVCKSKGGKYFIFGSNKYNQCLTFDGEFKVTSPYCINGIVKEMTKKKGIKGVYLGCNNTKIIVS